jgi:hypothetical protein
MEGPRHSKQTTAGQPGINNNENRNKVQACILDALEACQSVTKIITEETVAWVHIRIARTQGMLQYVKYFIMRLYIQRAKHKTVKVLRCRKLHT